MFQPRLIVALGLCVTTMVAAPARDAGAQNAVTDWSLKAQTVITAGRPPGSSEYLLALVHSAMYDAAVAVEGKYEPFGVKARARQQTSADAAVAAAAYHVLRQRLPAAAESLTTEYLAYIAALPPGSPRENGELLGSKIATVWLSKRADDGFAMVVPYVQPTPGPGVFERVAPTEPVDVKLGGVKPFGVRADRMRPNAPPRLTSSIYTKSFEEVAALGRATSTIRTTEQTEIARFWNEHAAAQWNRNLRRLAIESSLPLVDTARMMAMTHVATADAAITCFGAKYEYLFWRPVHAIQRADTDENPLTTPDFTWTPLLVVNHPEYPSAHSCLSSAITETLTAFFGGDTREVTLDSTFTGTTRKYESFSEILREVGDARIFAGLHFRFSVEQGAAVGRRVSRAITNRYFLPVGS